MRDTFTLNGKTFCASAMSVEDLVDAVCNNTFADFESEKHIVHLEFIGKRTCIIEERLAEGETYDGLSGIHYHNGHWTDWNRGCTTREGIKIIDTYYKYCN